MPGSKLPLGKILRHLQPPGPNHRQTPRHIKWLHRELERRISERTAQLLVLNHQLTRDLQEREARHRALLQAIPDLMFINDNHGVFLDYHATNPEMLLQLPSQFLGRTIEQVLPPPLARSLMDCIDRALKTNQIQIHEFTLNPQGVHRHWEARIVACDTDKVFTIVRDISENRRLMEEILEISQKERQRLGQDFHDLLGQNLVALAILSRSLSQQLKAHHLPESNQARELEDLASQIIQQAGALARGLSPIESTADGLMHALDSMAAHVTQMFQLSCQFECAAPVLVPSNYTAVHLYCIAQEAVNNAVKHGRARHIVIALQAETNQLSLKVKDDGVGMPPHPHTPCGMGLRTMSFRARILGGNLDFFRAPSGGTVVHCALPLPPPGP